MVVLLERSGKEEGENEERRIKKNMLLHRIGMIYMILPGLIVMRNIRIVMRRSEKLRSGRTGYMLIEKRESHPVKWIAMRKNTDRR